MAFSSSSLPCLLSGISVPDAHTLFPCLLHAVFHQETIELPAIHQLREIHDGHFSVSHLKYSDQAYLYTEKRNTKKKSYDNILTT